MCKYMTECLYWKNTVSFLKKKHGFTITEFVTIIDTSIGDLPLIITISDTCKKQPKRLDSDNTISLSSLIVNLGRRAFSNSHIFMLYIIYWSVGVSLHHVSRPSGSVSPILDALGRHGRCWSFDNLTTSSTHWRQCGGCCTSFHHGLHGTVEMVSCAHAVYVICYFCYMLFNAHLCMHIIPLWTGGGT